jgi:uncharacterized protein (DUF2267 family)
MSTRDKFIELAAHAYQWVSAYANENNVPAEKSYRIIRITLQTLRDQIPVEESIQLIAQLPVFWKGIYVDGWKPNSGQMRIRKMKDYIQAIRERDHKMAGYDFGNDEQAQKIILAVWDLLFRNISANEMKQICHALPSEIAKYFKYDKTSVNA